MSSTTTLRAINDMVVGLKADGVWTKLTEVYLLSCVTSLSGLLIKLKGTGSLTNANFVSGDYVAAGSGAGLKGNASSKYLNTGITTADIDQENSSASAYVIEISTSAFEFALGVQNDDASHFRLGQFGTTDELTWEARSASLNSIGSATPGFWSGSIGVEAVGVRDLYKNGIQVATGGGNSINGTSTHPIALFGVISNSGSFAAGNASNARMTFAHIGTGLTDTDAANLSARVNALMTAIGANVY